MFDHKNSLLFAESAEESSNKKHNLLLFLLQFECDAAVPELTGGSGGGGGRLHIDETVGRAKDVSEIKMLVSPAHLPSVSLVSLWCITSITSKKKRSILEECPCTRLH